MEEMEKNNEETLVNPSEQPAAEEAMPFSLHTEEPAQTSEEPAAEAPEETPAPKEKKCKLNCNPVSLVIDLVLLLAVVLLFVLHFQKDKEQPKQIANVENVAATPGTGEIYYINIDSVNASPYVKAQIEPLEKEATSCENTFNAKQKKIQKDYEQLQQNANSGAINDQQAALSMKRLEDDFQRAQEAYQKSMQTIIDKQEKTMKEIMGTIRSTVAAINTQSSQAPNASFVITYSEDTPMLFYVDPSRDMTKAVLEELSKIDTSKKDDKTNKK